MTIKFKKYAYTSDGNSNYFNLLPLVDGITFFSVYDAGFPTYSEEYTAHGGTEFDIVASDFDLVFSLLSQEVSGLGLTIKDFLNPTDNDNNLYRFACEVQFGSGKVIGGMIDTSQTEFDFTYINKKYQVKITVLSWEKEFSTFPDLLRPTDSHITIDQYIKNYLFNSSELMAYMPPYLKFNLQFNWLTKVSWTPVLVAEAWNAVVSRGIQENGWQLFKELSAGLGFAFRLTCDGTQYSTLSGDSYFNVTLNCYWASDGGTLRTINVKEHLQTYEDYSYQYVILGYVHLPGQQSVQRGGIPPLTLYFDASCYGGLLLNGDKTFLNDGNVGAGTASYYFVSFPDNLNQASQWNTTINSQRNVMIIGDYKPTNGIPFNFPYGDNQPSTNLNGRSIYNANKSSVSIKYDRIYYIMNDANHFWSFVNQPFYNYIAFARFFVKDYTIVTNHILSEYFYQIRDTGWNGQGTLPLATAAKEYQNLVQGVVPVKKLKIVFDSTTNLQIGDSTKIGTDTYILRKLENIDLQNEEADSIWRKKVI